jgi:hypothetical protein
MTRHCWSFKRCLVVFLVVPAGDNLLMGEVENERIRTLKAMLGHLRKTGGIIAEGMKAFADIKAGDSVGVGAGKVALIAAKRTVYIVADYWLAALCAALNILLKTLEVRLLYAFIAMWGINILIAGVFLAIYAKTGHDISLGEDLRRASDAIHKKSKFAGYLAMLGVILQAAVWSGPEQVVIFFRKEIGCMTRMVAVMLFLTVLQTGAWMYLYRTGYDAVTGLL